MASRREMLRNMAFVAGAAARGPLYAADGEAKGSHPAKYWHAFGDDIQCDLVPIIA